jgi:hypothetical protein
VVRRIQRDRPPSPFLDFALNRGTVTLVLEPEHGEDVELFDVVKHRGRHVFSTTLWGTSSSAGMSCHAGFAWVQPCDRAALVDTRLRRRRS